MTRKRFTFTVPDAAVPQWDATSRVLRGPAIRKTTGFIHGLTRLDGLAALFLLLLLPFGAAAQALNVTIIDYAGVPPQTLAQAGEIFSGLYRKAGSQVTWAIQTNEWRPGERTYLANVPGDIVLRICSREMAKKLVRKNSVLGYAQPPGEGELPRVANVFYHRVELIAATQNVELIAATQRNAAEVLGAALAHELGHLLLGHGAHSRMGIMRSSWDAGELRSLRRGQLTFDQQQAESIARAIGARTSHQEIVSTTTPRRK